MSTLQTVIPLLIAVTGLAGFVVVLARPGRGRAALAIGLLLVALWWVVGAVPAVYEWLNATIAYQAFSGDPTKFWDAVNLVNVPAIALIVIGSLLNASAPAAPAPVMYPLPPQPMTPGWPAQYGPNPSYGPPPLGSQVPWPGLPGAGAPMQQSGATTAWGPAPASTAQGPGQPNGQ